jgi:hypothetical protein
MPTWLAVAGKSRLTFTHQGGRCSRISDTGSRTGVQPASGSAVGLGSGEGVAEGVIVGVGVLVGVALAVAVGGAEGVAVGEGVRGGVRVRVAVADGVVTDGVIVLSGVAGGAFWQAAPSSSTQPTRTTAQGVPFMLCGQFEKLFDRCLQFPHKPLW